MNIKKIGFRVTTFIAYFLIYFPIFVIILLSLNDSSFSFEFVGFSLRHYIEIFNNDGMTESIVNTLKIAFASTFISTIAGTLIAIGINSLKKKNRIRVMVINNIPVINPDIVTGISLMIVFSVLSFKFNGTTVLLAHVFFSIPFVVLTVLPKLKELDPNLFDAALDLGCNYFQGIYKVILPSIKSGIIAGALIAFTMSIDDFVISYFTTGDGFNNFSIWLYSSIQRNQFPPEAYAYNTLLIVIAISVIGYMNLKTKNRVKRRER